MAFLFSMFLQLLISYVVGSALSSMWMLINVMQLINYVAMMTLYFPKTYVMMLSFISITSMESDVLSDMYEAHIDSHPIQNRTSWDYRFVTQGVESTHILLNCSDMFAGLILIFSYYGIVYLLSCCIKPPNASNTKKGC